MRGQANAGLFLSNQEPRSEGSGLLYGLEEKAMKKLAYVFAAFAVVAPTLANAEELGVRVGDQPPPTSSRMTSTMMRSVVLSMSNSSWQCPACFRTSRMHSHYNQPL